ncbi:phosphatidylinositol 4-phosphate 5-kinase type-1 alpha-like isoform X2 [Engraulis encrasicolus]|uniref:phosphatidylinositol 4-phosphate 5-kinase type-1 alpha-like isoform X2 n=1 Tax=Engraulis encrasicolus TaxID=184585 RepID=UPI002FD5CE6B
MMDDDITDMHIPDTSISNEVLKVLHLDETEESSTHSEQYESAQDLTTPTSEIDLAFTDEETVVTPVERRTLDTFHESLSRIVADLQRKHNELLSTVEQLNGKINDLCEDNKKLRDEIKNQWEVIQDAGLSSPARIKKIIGHRGVDVTGQTTYKQTTASALEHAIKLGIDYTVELALCMDKREVLIQDFEVVESIFFPRTKFGICHEDFKVALCDRPLRELPNSGASGSLFYISYDDRFILKTVECREAEFLQRMLPGYYNTQLRNRYTLLPKFYGLYCVSMGGKNIRIVVMNNLLPTTVPVHIKYDLKGSTHRRHASVRECAKEMPTYKDLDFLRELPEGLLMEAGHHDIFRRTIHEDCLLLRSFSIMDYSLLVAIHKVKPGEEDIRSLTSDHSIGVFPASTSKGEKMLVFTGIIDVLQSYRLKKKLEHSLKSIFWDGDTVSVHQPGFYAERFETFICEKVFKRTPLKSSKSQVGCHLEPRPSPSKRAAVATHQPGHHSEAGHPSTLKSSPGHQTSKATGQQGQGSASPKHCQFVK